MKIKQKNRLSKKVLVSILVLITIFAACSVLYLLSIKQSDSTENNTSTYQSKDTKSAEDDNASNTVKPVAGSTSENGHEAEKDIRPNYEGDDINSSDSLTGVINYSGVAGDKLIIRTTINQTITSGSCHLTLTKDGKSVSRHSGLIQNPSSSSCEGFDIPVSELSTGDWNVSIKVTDDNRSGQINGTARV